MDMSRTMSRPPHGTTRPRRVQIPAVRDVTISIAEGEVELSTASGDRLAVGPVVGTVASKLVAGFTRTMAGVIVDFGDHKWMINFGALSRLQPASVTVFLKALDPTGRFRAIKKTQRTRDDFVDTFERLGGRVTDPSL